MNLARILASATQYSHANPRASLLPAMTNKELDRFLGEITPRGEAELKEIRARVFKRIRANKAKSLATVLVG